MDIGLQFRGKTEENNVAHYYFTHVTLRVIQTSMQQPLIN